MNRYKVKAFLDESLPKIIELKKEIGRASSRQFIRIIMITAFIGLNKSLKNPINNLVLILPIMVNDMKVAPIVADK